MKRYLKNTLILVGVLLIYSAIYLVIMFFAKGYNLKSYENRLIYARIGYIYGLFSPFIIVLVVYGFLRKNMASVGHKVITLITWLIIFGIIYPLISIYTCFGILDVFFSKSHFDPVPIEEIQIKDVSG